MIRRLSMLLAAAVVASGALSIPSYAQDDAIDGYVMSGTRAPLRAAYGQCVRTGYWTPAVANAQCDTDLARPSGAAATPSSFSPASRSATADATPAPAAAPAPTPLGGAAGAAGAAGSAAGAAPAKPKPVAEKITYAADVFFDFDRAIIKPDGKSKLDDLSMKMRDINVEVVIAMGHTDSMGSHDYNQRLSERRANAVKAYLVSRGVEANRVYTEGKGKRQPIADNKTDEGRAKNRRTEIEVIGTRK